MQISKLMIKNFKGIKSLEIPFSVVTNIHGDNAVGKTTVADAVSWLLFDKDSSERSVFEIKPLDKDNNPIHFLQTEVEATFDHDGTTFTLRKVFEEKWVKTRGQAEQKFSGHTTTYYIDGIPVKKAEYQAYISDLHDEKVFKLLTNPFAFEKMKWQDKRNLLFTICGDVSDEDVICNDQKLVALAGQDIERLKKSTAALKKQLKIDIQNIPPRIDELTSTLQDIDKDSINVAIRAKEKKIKELDKQLEADNQLFEEKRQKQQEVMKLENDYNLLKMKLLADSTRQINDLKMQQTSTKQSINQAEYLIANKQQALQEFVEEVGKFEEEMKLLRLEYTDQMKVTFTPEFKCTCPTCNQILPDEMIKEKEHELTSNFEKEKQTKLDAINKRGVAKKEYVAKCKQQQVSLQGEINELITKLTDAQEKLTQINSNIKRLEEVPEPTSTVEMDTICASIDVLKRDLETITLPDTANIKLQKQTYTTELDGLKQELTKAAIQEGTLERIEELKAKHKDLNQQLADVERQEFLVEAFTRAKVDMLTERINSRFKYVNFKLFKEQVNGGLEECCESLIAGVPFSDANNAACINAGLDIINTLADHFKFCAPIFIDNAEGVNELIETKGQIIRLVVSKDKELKLV